MLKNNVNDNNDQDYCHYHYRHFERRNWRFFFYNILTVLGVLQTVSKTYTQVARAQSCANHMQHIRRSSLATCHVPHGRKGQLSYYLWQSLDCTYFSFILLAETINRWSGRGGGGGDRSTWRKPTMMNIRKCHILRNTSCHISGQPSWIRTCTFISDNDVNRMWELWWWRNASNQAWGHASWTATSISLKLKMVMIVMMIDVDDRYNSIYSGGCNRLNGWK